MKLQAWSHNKLFLHFSKKQGKREGRKFKLQRWLHEEVQVTGVGRLLWFFASRLQSCLPLEQKSEEGWTMRWMEALD